MEDQIHDILEGLFTKLGCSINKIRIEKAPEENSYKINLTTDNPNLMIGHHGENIGALQHLAKLLIWKEFAENRPEISLDIDNYRKRQEENIIKMAERKVDMVRKLSSPQSLPAMSPYFRRLVHLHLTQDKFHDITTESQGQGEYRYIVIKPELII